MRRPTMMVMPLLMAACVVEDGVGTADENYATEAQGCGEQSCNDALDSVNVLVFANRVQSGNFPFRTDLPEPGDYDALETGEMTGYCDVAFRSDAESGTDKRLLFCANAVRLPGEHADALIADILQGSFAEMVFGGGEAFYERGFVGADASCKGLRQVFDFYPETIVGDVPAAKLSIALAEPRLHGEGMWEIPARLLPPPEALHDDNPGDGCGVIQETGDVHGDMRLFVGTRGTGADASTLFVMSWEGMTVEPLGASKESFSSVANAVREAFLQWLVGDGHNGAMQHGMTTMGERYTPMSPAPTLVPICDATASSAWNWQDDSGESLCR